MRFLALLFAVSATTIGFSGTKTEVLSNSYGYEQNNSIKQDVDTKTGNVYGLSLGSSEKEMRAHFGDPIGIIYINEDEKVFVYGSKFATTIEHGFFTKAMIGSSIFDYLTGIKPEINAIYDIPQWEIDGKVRNSDSFESVVEKLGLRNQSPEHSLITVSGRILLRLQFSKRISPYGSEDYQLRSFTVERTR